MTRINRDGSAHSDAFVRLPAHFLAQVAPQIDSLAELKVTLFFLAALQQKEGDYRFLRLGEFLADEPLMQGLARAGGMGAPAEVLGAALDGAVKRGTLLTANLTVSGCRRQLYFMNDERGSALQQRILAGGWRPAADREIEVLPARPTVFALYEENIGILTPMIADAIREAEATYRREWIEEALRIAVERNARNWRYVAKILERWQQEGRSLETGGRDDRRRRRTATGKRQRTVRS